MQSWFEQYIKDNFPEIEDNKKAAEFVEDKLKQKDGKMTRQDFSAIVASDIPNNKDVIHEGDLLKIDVDGRITKGLIKASEEIEDLGKVAKKAGESFGRATKALGHFEMQQNDDGSFTINPIEEKSFNFLNNPLKNNQNLIYKDKAAKDLKAGEKVVLPHSLVIWRIESIEHVEAYLPLPESVARCSVIVNLIADATEFNQQGNSVTYNPGAVERLRLPVVPDNIFQTVTPKRKKRKENKLTVKDYADQSVNRCYIKEPVLFLADLNMTDDINDARYVEKDGQIYIHQGEGRWLSMDGIKGYNVWQDPEESKFNIDELFDKGKVAMYNYDDTDLISFNDKNGTIGGLKIKDNKMIYHGDPRRLDEVAMRLFNLIQGMVDQYIEEKLSEKKA